MTELDLTKLREIAEAATTTPGPWSEYLLAFDPPTVIALIDEIEWLRRGIKHSADILEPLSKTWLKQNNLELGVPMRYQVELMRELLDQNEAGGSDE